VFNENLKVMLISIEEYRRFWQIVEELETLMWKVKNQNEKLVPDEE